MLFLSSLMDSFVVLSFSTLLKKLVDQAFILGDRGVFADFIPVLSQVVVLLLFYGFVAVLKIVGWQNKFWPK